TQHHTIFPAQRRLYPLPEQWKPMLKRLQEKAKRSEKLKVYAFSIGSPDENPPPGGARIRIQE
ncbi:MAG: hypothetical protein OEY85_10715, partial [Rhodospirillales bacterium]|nr:hypothetical protein [Rhodospirillales bacterium]